MPDDLSLVLITGGRAAAALERRPPVGCAQPMPAPPVPLRARARLIRLRERSLRMLKNDTLARNPLNVIGLDSDAGLPPGSFGAILARAGVGKTAFAVQVAINAMLRGQHVLHLSLNDPVDKVTVWYREVFQHLAADLQVPQAGHVWEGLQPFRFIMTFKVEGFSVPKLEERWTDLAAQGIFTPRLLIVDGLPVEADCRDLLTQLQKLAQRRQTPAWLTIRTHRHETPGPDGLPPQLDGIADLFAVAVHLVPEGQDVRVKVLKGLPHGASANLVLDPATMLVRKGTSPS